VEVPFTYRLGGAYYSRADALFKNDTTGTNSNGIGFGWGGVAIGSSAVKLTARWEVDAPPTVTETPDGWVIATATPSPVLSKSPEATFSSCPLPYILTPLAANGFGLQKNGTDLMYSTGDVFEPRIRLTGGTDHYFDNNVAAVSGLELTLRLDRLSCRQMAVFFDVLNTGTGTQEFDIALKGDININKGANFDNDILTYTDLHEITFPEAPLWLYSQDPSEFSTVSTSADPWTSTSSGTRGYWLCLSWQNLTLAAGAKGSYALVWSVFPSAGGTPTETRSGQKPTRLLPPYRRPRKLLSAGCYLIVLLMW
jgi:hypothetical protein